MTAHRYRYVFLAAVASLLVLAGTHALLRAKSASASRQEVAQSSAASAEGSRSASARVSPRVHRLSSPEREAPSMALRKRAAQAHDKAAHTSATAAAALSEEERQKQADREAYYAAQAQAEVHGGGGVERARKMVPEETPASAAVNNVYPVQETFERAAREFGVPAELLKAVAYVETHGEQRSGSPSIDGGYGVMNLRQSSLSNTLNEAATLLGADAATLKSDPVQNIRAAAALLKAYHDDAAALDSSMNPWLAAVTFYSGFTDQQSVEYARQIEQVLEQGISCQTTFGDTMVIEPKRHTLLSSSAEGAVP